MLRVSWKSCTRRNDFERAPQRQGPRLRVRGYKIGHKNEWYIEKKAYLGKSDRAAGSGSLRSIRRKLVCFSSNRKDLENPAGLDSEGIEGNAEKGESSGLKVNIRNLYRAGAIAMIRAARILGRRQVGLAGINVLTLLLVLKTLSHGDTQAEYVELFYLYFQPFAPFLCMLWGWGLNVLYFERAGWKYDLCFGEKDRKYLLHASQILQVGWCCSVVCMACIPTLFVKL